MAVASLLFAFAGVPLPDFGELVDFEVDMVSMIYFPGLSDRDIALTAKNVKNRNRQRCQ